jgi:protein-tyrosine phosphatase
MQSVLFVCLGNICRSPIAQGLFEYQIERKGCSDLYRADSAGTSGWHEGEPPHRGSVQIARQHGITIEKQRSRPVHNKDGEIFDFIIAMDTANRDSLIHEFRFPENKVFLMRDFSIENPRQKGLSVPDPWEKGDAAFAETFAILNDAVAGFVNYLTNRKDL